MLSLLIAVILLLFSLYLFSSFVKPAFVEVRGLREEAAGSSGYLEAQQEARTAIDKLYNDFKNAANIEGLLAASLPSGADVPGAVNQTQALARLAGLDVRSVMVTVRATEDGTTKTTFTKKVGSMEISLKAAGGYESAKRFLSLLESNITIMDVTSLKVATGALGGAAVYDFVINTYYQE